MIETSFSASRGPTFSHQWDKHGLANIIDITLVPKAIKWARLALQINPDFATIIIMTLDNWSTTYFTPPNN
jgi:hypothetical protein